MEKYVLSVLVANHTGVLSRVAGLFSRRAYNIESLSVGETENPDLSRMTIVTEADKPTFLQIKNQLAKLQEVMEIKVLAKDDPVYWQHMLMMEKLYKI